MCGLKVYRQSELQTILVGKLGIVTISRSYEFSADSHMDIRPIAPLWNGVVDRIRRSHILPTITIPCVAYLRS